MIAGRAARTRSIIGTLIGILFVAILAGGFVVIRGVREEISLAAKKTTFVANVSHELKTPLTSIRMFAEMLRDGRQADAAKRQSYLDIMVSESERLSRLIDNVLDFSRPEKARKYAAVEMDLNDLVDQTLESIRPALRPDGLVPSRAAAGSGPLPVSVDPEAMKQVLLNLISNAVKYCGERREIRIETAGEGDRAVVRVMDRGIGISARNARRIFREFYRVDDSLASGRQGAGLGLTIASRIARDHGGAVAYHPREGGGSCFEVRLPLREGAALQEGEEGGREDPGGGG
jgi:signal transduction histidine kinase